MRPATSRNEIVAAAITSGYKPLRRQLVLALALAFDDTQQAIPAGLQPSLNDLAWLTGMSRASVKRHLNWLEHADPVQVRRHRPLPADARRYHRRTAYTVFVTDQHGSAPAMPGLTLQQQLGARRAMSGPTLQQWLGAGGAAGDDDDMTTSAPWLDSSIVAVAADELSRATGRQITQQQAADAVRQICEGRQVKKPVPYIRRAIRDNARRWLPTGGPAPYETPAAPDKLPRERIREILGNPGAGSE